MSYVVELVKEVWEHRVGIFDAATFTAIGTGAFLVGRRLFTVEVGPDRVAVAFRVIGRGGLRVLRDDRGNPRQGMVLRDPRDVIGTMYLGEHIVPLSDKTDDGEHADIALRYTDPRSGRESDSHGWKFDTSLRYRIDPRGVDQLMRSFGSGPDDVQGQSLDRRIRSAVVNLAQLARADALTGRQVQEMGATGVMSRLSRVATGILQERLNENPWGQSIQACLLITDSKEPTSIRTQADKIREAEIDEEVARIQLKIDKARVRSLGAQTAVQLEYARKGGNIVNVVGGSDRGSRIRDGFVRALRSPIPLLAMNQFQKQVEDDLNDPSTSH